MGKVTNVKLGRYIQSIHANKSRLNILEKMERGRIQGVVKEVIGSYYYNWLLFGGVGWSESLANEPGHYGGHPRPQVADRGTPSRSGTRG